MRIGILDSGVGGLTVLYQLQKDFPEYSFVYLADQRNMPYSEKDPDELLEITRQNIHFLVEKQCDVVVIACNTLTVTIIEQIRAEFPELPLVGTQPAIRPAVALTPPDRKISILATRNTIESRFIASEVGRNQQRAIDLVVSTKLVELIEEENWTGVSAELHTLFPQQSTQPQSVVLGCTHFPLITAEIREILGEDVAFFTPNRGISSRLRTVLAAELGAPSASTPKDTTAITFFSTLPDAAKLHAFWERNQERLRGR